MALDHAALLAWFGNARRPLPWREEPPNPYHVWLSEVMTQQTVIKAAIPYYERFLERFPSLAELAAAPLEEVLELWAGLGYYRRARFLHAAAQGMAKEGFPSSAAALRELPGIGEYTAAAVASIVFDEAVPVIDGNVERVLCRIGGIGSNPRRGEGRKRLRSLAFELVPESGAGTYNQALMELGSLICRPGHLARCEDCPVAPGCLARAKGQVAELPMLPARPKTRKRLDRAAAISREGKLLYGRRRPGSVWGGLLELPRLTSAAKEKPAESLRRIGVELLGCELSPRAPGLPLLRHQHGVMNERITLELFAAEALGEPEALGYQELLWLGPEEAARSALPSPQKKILRRAFAALSPGVAG